MRTKLSTARLTHLHVVRASGYAHLPSRMCRASDGLPGGRHRGDARVQALLPTGAANSSGTQRRGDRPKRRVVDARRTLARPTPCPSRPRGRGTVGRIQSPRWAGGDPDRRLLTGFQKVPRSDARGGALG